jgi:two-component system, OmpR family, sensor kinase
LKTKFLWAWERISLRAKLTTMSVGLIGLLLAVSSAGTVALLSTYLQRNTDTLLIATASTLSSENPLRLDRRVANGELTLPSLPSDYYIAILNEDGQQFLGLVSSAGNKRATPNFSSLTLEVVQQTQGIPFDVEVNNPTGPDTTWRLVALPLNRAIGSVVVALPTNTNRQIINEYGSIGGRFGIFLIVLSGLSIWLTITSALRPLREVERTAQSVKAGQFSSRLIERHGKTEIGRLNNALNSMLDSIESAVRGKDKTLEQMRRFVSDASHELRTPLVTVRGYAELYRMGAIKKPKDVAEAMERIESEAIRMTGLVESLLTLTRMDELGQLNTQKVTIDSIASPVVKDASVANSNVKFEFVDDTQGVEVELDADRIKQVLTNLVANASRFAPAGSTVTVTAAQDKQHIKISVIDRGEGIPEPLQEKVFDRFYRADTSRNRETGGSGLGLAIARSIINAHGGKIWNETTPGGGATFSFEIPISQS